MGGPVGDFRRVSVKGPYLKACNRRRVVCRWSEVHSHMSREITQLKIAEAIENSSLALDLSGCSELMDLGPLAGLTALQSLDITFCEGITDLGPLAGLTALQSLELTSCKGITDLGPLAGLTALQSLELTSCKGITDLGPLGGLTTLQSLELTSCKGITDLGPLAGLTALQKLTALDVSITKLPVWITKPSALVSLKINGLIAVPNEIQSANIHDDCLPRILAWSNDLQSGQTSDQEIKLFLLGNGGVGKTQLRLFMQSRRYDPKVLTTHGVRLAHVKKEGAPIRAEAALNIWDFGGQDIYHGTHALFLKGHAVFLILWIPIFEKATQSTDLQNDVRHRPLAYWLDYVRELAGKNSPMIVVQSQCESRLDEIRAPEELLDQVPGIRTVAFSARTLHGARTLAGAIADAVEELNQTHPPPLLGLGWAGVRDELHRRLISDGIRTLDRNEFDNLCTAIGGVSDSGILLEYLHRAGVVFHRPNLFHGKIILDQGWALEAIYTVFDRERTLPWLRGDGTFTRRDLDRIVWREKFSADEQELFISMMETCGICFQWRKNSKGETVWVAPELLPAREVVQDHLAGRLRQSDLPKVRSVFHYRFLHDGIIRQLLATVGRKAKDAAVYWRNGLWLYESGADAYAVVEAKHASTATEPAKGLIELLVYGDRPDHLVAMLHEVISKIEPYPSIIENGQPGVSDSKRLAGEADQDPLSAATFTAPAPTPRGARDAVYISYAWEDDTAVGKKRAAMVDGLCSRLRREGIDFRIDREVMKKGDSISAFMKNFGTADHVVAVISDKYLRSPYCMAELHSLWENSNRDTECFRRRVHPLFLDDARAGRTLDRLEWARHWTSELKALEAAHHELGRAFGLEDQRQLKVVTEFALWVSDILHWLNDVLMPRGFDRIQADDFQAIIDLVRPPDVED